MSETESSLEAEITHLVELVKLLQEEIRSLQRDVYILQSNPFSTRSHVGTFIK
jgi:S-adenosylhomocysteine hydrolase